MKEDIQLFLENVLASVIEMLPRISLAIVIILAGYLVGRLVQRLVKRFILYLNEGMNQRLKKSMLNVDLRNSARFISATFFWAIITISLLICIQVLRLEVLSIWLERIIGFLPNTLAAVIIIFVGIISGRLLGDLVHSATAQTGLANGRYLGKAVRYLILFVTIVIAVDQLGVDIAFLTNLSIIILASLLFGAALAFGLGAKTSVSNILGSYYARKSYQLGSKIKIGELQGTIVKITDHAVSLETVSGLIVIPAKDFSESSVIILKINRNE